MARTRSRRVRGFTLLEILVAFIVLAVAGGALLQLFQGGLQNLTLAAEYTQAALLARSKLAELDARAEVSASSEEGSFDDQFRWEVTLQPYVDADGATPPEAGVQAMQLELTVLWGAGPDERRYAVQSLLLTKPLAQEGP